MNDKKYIIKKVDAEQRRFILMLSKFTGVLRTRQQSRGYRGGMLWKKVAAKEYFYHYRDRYGHGNSLGTRSEKRKRLSQCSNLVKRNQRIVYQLLNKECMNKPVL